MILQFNLIYRMIIINFEFIMNWVGGARRRVGLKNEKKTQKVI